MLDKTGFRKDGYSQFFNQIAMSVPFDRKQSTPFIVNDKDTVRKCDTLKELLEYGDNTEVLQTWPGKSRSDVFYFTVKDIREHFEKGDQK